MRGIECWLGVACCPREACGSSMDCVGERWHSALSLSCRSPDHSHEKQGGGSGVAVWREVWSLSIIALLDLLRVCQEAKRRSHPWWKIRKNLFGRWVTSGSDKKFNLCGKKVISRIPWWPDRFFNEKFPAILNNRRRAMRRVNMPSWVQEFLLECLVEAYAAPSYQGIWVKPIVQVPWW